MEDKMNKKAVICTGVIVLLVVLIPSIFQNKTVHNVIKLNYQEGARLIPKQAANSNGSVHAGGVQNIQTLPLRTENSPQLNTATAFGGMGKPKKPVHKHISEYMMERNHAKESDLALLADLSFCANRYSINSIIAQEKGRDPAGAAELEKSLNDYTEYCVGVNDRDYLMRREILQKMADKGDGEAQVLFFHAGPAGRWFNENEYIPMTSEEISSWLDTSISYLKASAQSGNTEAYQVLGSIYSADEKSPLLGRVHDPVQAYAYNYLWASLEASKSPPNTRAAIMRYMEAVEQTVTPEQREQGRRLARDIFINGRK